MGPGGLKLMSQLLHTVAESRWKCESVRLHHKCQEAPHLEKDTYLEPLIAHFLACIQQLPRFCRFRGMSEEEIFLPPALSSPGQEKLLTATPQHLRQDF